MLSVNKYKKEYIAQCRRSVDRQLAAYKALVAAAGKSSDAKDKKAIAAFEPMFCNNMVLVLDNYFLHRSRTLEGKDGNPLNEVRVLVTSLTENEGVMAADKQIKLKPEHSVLKLRVGDAVALSAADLSRLAKAYFDEMERRFS